MYLQHRTEPTVYKFKYFTPESNIIKDTVLNHGDGNEVTEAKNSEKVKRDMQSFLDPDEKSFDQIRNRLSTLSLNSAYKKALETPVISPPFQRERKFPQRRISSISSRETVEKIHDGHPLTKPRVHSRSSFLSDDKEFRHARRQNNFKTPRASETAALNKLNENILTPGQNPELFSRQIRLKDKSERNVGKGTSTRSSSPKSLKSIDSSGKVHLGLIESLDLNEQLHDVEKIKERYSNNAFMHSLTLYKLRGHDRCLRHDGTSDHIHRGTRIGSPDGSWIGSKTPSDSSYAINSIISPRLANRLHPPFDSRWQWEPDKSHVNNQIDAKHKDGHKNERRTHAKRKKSVGFNMETKEHCEEDQKDTLLPPVLPDVSTKEIKSILKRACNEAHNIGQHNVETNSSNDEFLVNESYHWKFQLPKIRSPVQPLRSRAPMSFRRKMYHFGDGVSNEFEQVISKYGNCRQHSFVRDNSFKA